VGKSYLIKRLILPGDSFYRQTKIGKRQPILGGEAICRNFGHGKTLAVSGACDLLWICGN